MLPHLADPFRSQQSLRRTPLPRMNKAGSPNGVQWEHSQCAEGFYNEPDNIEAQPPQNPWYYPPLQSFDPARESGDYREKHHDDAMSGAARKKRAQVRIACTHCQKACKKCSNQRCVTCNGFTDCRPCERCIKYGLDDCVDSTRKPRKSGIKRGPYKRRQSRGVSHSIKQAYFDGMADVHHQYDGMATDFDTEPPYPRGYHDAFLPPLPANMTSPVGWSDESPSSTPPVNFGAICGLEQRRVTFPSINTLLASRNVTPQPPTSGFDVAPIHQVQMAPTFYSPLGQTGNMQTFSAPTSPKERTGGPASHEPDWEDLRSALARSSSAAPPDRSIDTSDLFRSTQHPFHRLRVATGYTNPVHSSPLSSPATQSPTLFDQPMEMDLDDLEAGAKPSTEIDMVGGMSRWPGEAGRTIRDDLRI